MRGYRSRNSGFLLAVIAILGSVDVRGVECPKEVTPVNGAGILEIQRCVTAVTSPGSWWEDTRLPWASASCRCWLNIEILANLASGPGRTGT